MRLGPTLFRWAFVLAVLITVPFLDDFDAWVLARSAFFAIAGLGLVFAFRFGGMLSLCQAALLGVGALSHAWMSNAGVPIAVSALVAMMTSAALAWIAISAFPKARGVFFVVATLAFQFLIERAMADLPFLSGSHRGLLLTRSYASSTGHALMGVIGFALLAELFRRVARSPVGLMLAAVRDDEVLARGSGLEVAALRKWAFSFAGACAGLAGVGLATLSFRIHHQQFGIMLSIEILLIAIVAHPRAPWTSFLASLLIIGSFHYLGDLDAHQSTVFGAALLTWAIAREIWDRTRAQRLSGAEA